MFNISLARILGKQDLDYVAQLIYPGIERLVAEGRITDHQLRKIADVVRQRGIEVLIPQARILDAVTLNTQEPDGYIVEAVMQLTDEVSLRHIIKKSSTKEDFDAAVETQGNVHAVLKGTPLEDAVPEPSLVNRKQRLLITPYAEGTTLHELLEISSPERKAAILERTVEDYARLFSQLNDPNSRERLAFPQSMRSFTDFFVGRYFRGDDSDHSAFIEVVKSNLTAPLDEALRSHIHGDLHGKNIIVNGKHVYLDWAKAASNGFPEFDISKLLEKESIDSTLEDRLVSHAADLLYGTDSEKQASKLRYTRNQIIQGLITAKRYVERAEVASLKQDAERFIALGTVAYSRAIQRLRQAHESDAATFPSTLVDAVLQTPPKSGAYTLRCVSLEESAQLQQRYNPEDLTSKTFAQQRPLDSLTRGSSGCLSQIHKEINAARWKRRGKRAGIIAGMAAMLAGLAFAGMSVRDALREKTDAITDIKRKHSQYEYAASYRNLFEYAYREVTAAIVDGEASSRFTTTDQIVNQVAREYGLEPALLRNMLEVNRTYAFETSIGEDSRRIPEVNLLDPYAAINLMGRNRVRDPLKNLRFGAQRIADLIRKHEGDTIGALYEFYDPVKNTYDYSLFRNIKPDEGLRMAEDLRRIVYGALHGRGVARDGGIYSTYLIPPDDNFPSAR
ncbi:MAG TPA: phosphotransferase [Candidatus Nanoarchaeia archaeon]|nr:phosphotransferase [Candidatus Nanoarchaeia archaeon]